MRATRNWAIWFAHSLFVVSVLSVAQNNGGASTVNPDELRSVLIEARDPVIQLAKEDSSSYDSRISQKVHDLVDGFLYLNDRDSVRYLQQHLKRAYADEVAHSLESPPTLDKRLTLASHLDSSTVRASTLGDIAGEQYRNGYRPEADRTLELAIQAALEPRDDSKTFESRPEEKLLQLANGLQTDGWTDGANAVLTPTKKLLESSGASGWDWRSLAETSMRTGNFALAREALDKVGDEEGRSEVEQKLQASLTTKLDPDAAIRSAASLTDTELRIRTLDEIAKRQISAGDLKAATATLAIALDATLNERDDTFQVFQLNDIAWLQIDAGDTDGAERTLETAVKANEKHRWGADQVNGWVALADTFAFLGHFERAHSIALRSDDSSFRGAGLNVVAYREVAAGHSGDALAWANTLRDPDERSAAFLGVAKAMIDDLKDAPSR